MASSFEKFQKRRVITSYFSVVLSVFLVLFLLGTLGLFVINSKRISDNFKKDIVMTIFMKNEANDSIIKAFDEELRLASFAKDYVYVSKEQQPSQFVSLGKLKSVNGGQSYTFTSPVNFDDYKYAVVHCQQYNHLFSYALLQKQ